jgi:hypothetical protein
MKSSDANELQKPSSLSSQVPNQPLLSPSVPPMPVSLGSSTSSKEEERGTFNILIYFFFFLVGSTALCGPLPP